MLSLYKKRFYLNGLIRIFLGLCFILIFAIPHPGFAKEENKFEYIDINEILKNLDTGQRWKTHLKEDLLPFWITLEALGKRKGDFPTYRCNDGSLYDAGRPCKELQDADISIVKLDRDYVRAKSRQTYAYGIAFHLTGERKYLGYAKDGVDFLVANAMDHINGGAYSYWTIGGKHPESGPPVLQRTSQDLAYALSGMGFYYYLTRDEEVLSRIVKLKNYIFKTYYDKELDLLTWVREDSLAPDNDKTRQKELVSQLDQIYGYMIWLTPALPEPLQSEWERDLVSLAHIIIKQFYSERYGLFWGAVTDSIVKNLGTPHTDFGHSIKTMWLIYQIGKMTNNIDLIKFAEVRAIDIIKRAYLEDGTWARGYKKEGSYWIIDKDKEWWSLAELDQTTATLSLINPSFAKILTTTYKYWFETMVDKVNGGVWHMVNAKNNKPDLSIPKQHSWKNAFHTFEHALVGYITSQQLHSLPVELYYAFKTKPDMENIHPYLYFGKIKGIENLKDPQIWKVTFTDIR